MVGLWSPDPPPEPENIEGSNAGYVMVVTASDSEEDEGYEGYEPLSDADDGEIESQSGDSDQEIELQHSNESDSPERSRVSLECKHSPCDFHKIVPLPSNQIDEAGASCSTSSASQGSSEPARSRLDMGEQQVADVMAAMANVTLPPSAVPQWAAVVPEEQWLQHILARVKSLQDERSNEK